MADASDPLMGVHVIGCGIGEAIVLEFPNAPPAVIDCGRAGTAEFLLAFLKEMHVTELSFLAVSHPHEDHMVGLGRIIRHYGKRIGQVWSFPGFRFVDAVCRRLECASKLESPPPTDENLFCPSVQREWTAMSKLIDLHAIPGRRTASNWDQPFCIPGDPDVHIRCLVPVLARADKFEDALAQCAPPWSWLESYPDVAPWTCPELPRANDISSAFLVQWGDAAILLSGDAELPAWQEFEDLGGPLPESILVLKVGHHGSPNGTPDIVVNRLARERTHAVVTPFFRSGGKHPDPDTANRIAGRCQRLWVTSPVAGIVSSEPPRPGVPGTGDQPDFLAELAPACHGEGAALASLLLAKVDLPAEDASRVSFYFDDKGTLQKVVPGAHVVPWPA